MRGVQRTSVALGMVVSNEAVWLIKFEAISACWMYLRLKGKLTAAVFNGVLSRRHGKKTGQDSPVSKVHYNRYR